MTTPDEQITEITMYNVGRGLLATLTKLVLIIPLVAVAARRLHDLDKSGWWLLAIIPAVGWAILLIWYCRPGDPNANRLGPPPTAATLPMPVNFKIRFFSGLLSRQIATYDSTRVTIHSSDGTP
jgi:hypothetical protein